MSKKRGKERFDNLPMRTFNNKVVYKTMDSVYKNIVAAARSIFNKFKKKKSLLFFQFRPTPIMSSGGQTLKQKSGTSPKPSTIHQTPPVDKGTKVLQKWGDEKRASTTPKTIPVHSPKLSLRLNSSLILVSFAFVAIAISVGLFRHWNTTVAIIKVPLL